MRTFIILKDTSGEPVLVNRAAVAWAEVKESDLGPSGKATYVGFVSGKEVILSEEALYQLGLEPV